MKQTWLRCLAALLAPASGLLAQSVPDDWRVPEATIRFDIQVTSRPSQPSAGILVEIPDAGLLPGPAPLTQVFTPDGKLVESYTLWHSPGRNLAIIMGDASGKVSVYVQPASQYRLWSPASGLTPSAILTADPGKGTMEAAKALAAFGRVSPMVHHVNKAGAPKAPLSISGDESGRPRPASFYLLTHVISSDPGRTWIAPMTAAAGDSSEVRINGVALSPQKRIDKWGGTGDWAEIKPGANRVEIFLAAPGSKPYSDGGNNGLIYLTWRTPKATMDELGGIRSDAVPMPGTSRMETRVILDREIIRSGAGILQGAATRDGRPVALIRFGAPRVYWFDNETPLMKYRFESVPGSNPAATTYTWQFSDGITASGPAVEWILPGFQEHQVRLTAATPAGQTTATASFFGYSTSSTSLESAEDRAGFRSALWNMAKTYPAGHASVAKWDPAFWTTLLRTVEFGKGTPLLRELFKSHQAALEANVSVAQREALQDIFLDVAGRVNPQECFDWIRSFAKTTDGQRRKDELVIRAAEIHMHYLRDRESADKLLRTILRPELDDGQRFLRIRMGDLALLNGDLNLATRYYAEVQNYTRIRRSLPGQKDARNPASGQPTGRPLIGASMGQASADDWKLRALVDASASESVRSLLDQGHLLEAREMLRLWERDLPLSKISADFILLESTLFNAVNDPRRAMSMLLAFCETVESSNYMPQAAPVLLNLMMEAGEPPDRIRSIGERLQKRLEFHPIAEHLGRIMLLIPEKPEPRKEAAADEE